MIQINGNWEKVETLEDCIKIVRENLGNELADQITILTGCSELEKVSEALEEAERIESDAGYMAQLLRAALEE